MIVKSFTSDTVAGALKMARSELGGDAVILKTRKLDTAQRAATGAKVEVTACVDKPLIKAMPTTEPAIGPSAAPAVIPAERLHLTPEPARIDRIPAKAIVEKLDFLIDVLQMPIRKNVFSGATGRVFTALLRADVPEAMASDLAERLAARLGTADDYVVASSAVAEMLHQQIPTARDEYVFKTGQKIVLVGPAGGGKTALLGKLAGYLVSQRRLPVSLTSLDQIKVSAPEELQTLADILDVERFDMPREVDRNLLDREGKDKVTFIDTPALNPRDRENIALFAEKLARIQAHRVIGVFPAWCRAADVLDMLAAFRPLGLTEMAVTMTDQTDRLGATLAASIQFGLPITLLGTGRKAGALDLLPDHRRLIDKMFGMEKGGDRE